MNENVLLKMGYGFYIVGSKYGERINGQIANTVFQVTAKPPQISVCINIDNLTHKYISKSKVFSVSILSINTDMKLIGKFGFKSGKDIDKFNNTKYRIGITGSPIVLENSVGYLEAKVVKSMDIGSHTLFVGTIIECENLGDGEPMTYAYYHMVKNGKSPKNAPTYIKDNKFKKEEIMAKYKCKVCGYIYDPEKGDAENSVPTGTPFEKLPDDWICPICGVEKDQFEKIE